MIVGQMWLVESIIEIYEYCETTGCPELQYIDDLPFYEYISNQLSQYNQKLRKKNKEFIKDFISYIRDIIETECQDPSNLLKNMTADLDNRLKFQKKVHLELLRLAPNLDKGSIERLNREVFSFNSKFFGRKDLGVEYQRMIDVRDQVEKMEIARKILERSQKKKFAKSVQIDIKTFKEEDCKGFFVDFF
jgi:hypothetical protein